MGKLFAAPKPQIIEAPAIAPSPIVPAAPAAAPEVPKAADPIPLPNTDDAAARRAKIKEIAKVSRSSGRQSTMLTGSRLGDDSEADTRGGYGSRVLTG